MNVNYNPNNENPGTDNISVIKEVLKTTLSIIAFPIAIVILVIMVAVIVAFEILDWLVPPVIDEN